MTTTTSKSHFGFIGFGLIGGCIARALKIQFPDASLMAYNYYKTKKHPKLEQAKNEGILTEITTELSDFSQCDVIFLCAPVLTNISYLQQLKPYLNPNCLLTDVGSVKSDIHVAIEKMGLNSQFIGGHPMTGSEKTGWANSDVSYLKNCYYILTPTRECKLEDLAWMQQFVISTQAHCVILEPGQHDIITAGISHGPHVISASLVNTIKALDQSGKYQLLAAGGFKDITRISSSSPEMWQNICLANPDNIIEFIDTFIGTLEQAKEKIRKQDAQALLDFFCQAQEFRSHFTDKK